LAAAAERRHGDLLTDGRRAEEALHESEARFRLMADGCPMILWVDDAAGGLRFVNRAYREFFGTTIEQVEGGNWQPLVHPEDAPAYLEAFDRAVRDRAPFRAEARVRCADGEWRWIASHAEPRFAANGEYLGHIGVSPDITARRQMEDALRENQADLNRAQTVARTGSWRLDVRHNELLWSDETYRLFGVPKGTRLTYERFLAAVHPDDRSYVDQQWTAALRGQPYDIEHRILVGDTVIWVRERAELELDAGGALRGGFGTVQDITERKQVEDALREADRRKDEFLGMLSHELRNPLMPIRNSLYILEHAAPGGEQAKRAQRVIGRQVNHLARLVDDLLDVTRIARGKIHLQRTRVELNDVITRTVEDQRSLFADREVGLQVHLAAEPLFVSADPVRLAQLVGNLLQNAAKFTGRSGRATVLTARDAQRDHAIVRVCDTGAGIPPEMLPHLFEPFMQADHTLDRSRGGLGLGLALVRGLVELHDGEVSAHSDGLGKGAEFTVRLRLVRAQPADATERPAAAEATACRRVLVIEDNVDAADSLREALAIEGHVVEVAYDGAEGLEKLRVLRPELVFCDIGLPGMSGYEVARAIRAQVVLRDVVLVAVTGYAQPEEVAKAKEAGFDLHLAKPPCLEKLRALLARSADRSSRRSRWSQ
jgi:PAS domain S-box-containing protein